MFYKGMEKHPLSGSQKGNTYAHAHKQANAVILEAFEKSGGVDALVQWISDPQYPENRKEFYKIYSKLISPTYNIGTEESSGQLNLVFNANVKDAIEKI